MGLEACLFDLDGVLVDTAKYHYLAWKQLANSLGFDFSEEEYFCFIFDFVPLCAGNFACSDPYKIFQPAWFIMRIITSEVKHKL